MAATTGDLAPVAMRYSAYQEAKPATGKTAKRGCLSWNLALKNEELPDLGNDKLGAFSAYPIADGAAGVLVISWRTVLERIIAAKALSCFGLAASNFTFSELVVKGGLNAHVPWKLYPNVQRNQASRRKIYRCDDQAVVGQ
ncbi:hypothetical protein JZU57_00190 [bacterium]|nr:hypothetical protein [bacterium]